MRAAIRKHNDTSTVSLCLPFIPGDGPEAGAREAVAAEQPAQQDGVLPGRSGEHPRQAAANPSSRRHVG